MAYSMPTVLTPKGSRAYKNKKGNHECVVFVQDVTHAPATEMWKQGVKVLDAEPGSIRYGTVIATFDAFGHYSRGGPGQQHAAIYISHVKGESITVFEQYNAIGKVQRRTIHDKSADKKSNNPNAFSVVE